MYVYVGRRTRVLRSKMMLLALSGDCSNAYGGKCSAARQLPRNYDKKKINPILGSSSFSSSVTKMRVTSANVECERCWETCCVCVEFRTNLLRLVCQSSSLHNAIYALSANVLCILEFCWILLKISKLQYWLYLAGISFDMRSETWCIDQATIHERRKSNNMYRSLILQ